MSTRQVIRELKKLNWQPNQTNRFNFYHFLKKIKRELEINGNIELTPHTLRRSFTTYHAESGMPLPLLQKQLGHRSIKTTSLYWRNIYQEPFAEKIPINEDIADILAVKKWLEDKKEPNEPPTTENFPTIGDKESDQPNNFSLISSHEKKPTITNHNPNKLTGEMRSCSNNKHSQISPPKKKENKQQLPNINDKEQILLAKIKNLEEQLKQVQTENNNLRLENKHLKVLVQLTEKTEAKVVQPLL
ncbi:protein of unknown function (Integrase, catalytic domain) [endosymbiont DhMRE of Dentiscutata heterogama]|nr:protein of unknown function (Integrase, catalytic domain) [endosymbiont DhMRE of Dentiscutata heterogama]